MKSTRLSRLASVVASAMLAACANFSGIEPQSQSKSATDLSLSSTPMQWPDEQWWRAYKDPVLSTLIAQALANNPGIKLAQARLAQVAALSANARSLESAQLGLGIQSIRERFTENGLIPPPFAGATNSSNSFMLNASYEIDFWGKNRAALDAALSSESAAQAELKSARLLIAASVAKSYFSMAGALEQKGNLQTMLAQHELLLSLISQRVAAGMDSQFELNQAEASIPAIRAETIRQEEHIALMRNVLAALTGSGQGSTSELTASLPVIVTSSLPDAIPADLIGRRADIAAARSRVMVVSKQIEVAKAEFYPNVNLTAFVGFSSLGLSHWFDGSSRDYGIGPALSLPIFDGGRLRSNLRGKTADYDAALESYNLTLLEAVHDVADQVAALRSLALQQKQQVALQQSVESSYQLEQQRERAGMVSKLSTLNAQSAVLQQRKSAIELKARALDLSVNLNRALGGGFGAPLSADTL
ncbi:efflux transporter outer membrane subunit [Undibacterium sp. Ren11W]|uniref:efflux transporter outer membrane subunit n=1 Tax=Undibacterium sp. Ren11W TaxID=3413045 RepID=UPI003BF310EF